MKTTRTTAKNIAPLLKRADFLRLAASGRKWVTPHFIVQVGDVADAVAPRAEQSPQKTPTCRLGLTITKKVFPKAVDRNRVRRRLRAMVLDTLAANPPKLDIVIIARRETLKCERSALEKDLKWALKRLLTPSEPAKPVTEGGKNGK